MPLLDSGVISEGNPVEREEGGPGRRKVPLSVRPDCAYLLGTDLEGGALRACVLDACREVVAGEVCAIGADWPKERLLREWRNLLERVLARAAVPPGRLAAMGAGLPGVVARSSLATRTFLPSGQWSELDAAEPLRAIGVPVSVANNVLCVSEYEQRLGLAREESSFLSVLVRYGIGAALYAEGHQFVGETQFAGEIGHMRMFEDGPVCTCGMRGCLDVVASGRTMPNLAVLDPVERQAVLRLRAEALGRGIANLLKVFQPSAVLLNGVYNPHAEEFSSMLAGAIDAEFGTLPLARPRLLFGEHADFKSSIGAALRAGAEFLPDFFAARMEDI
jgi:predicted NBD/HSP70 family sugar kinase